MPAGGSWKRPTLRRGQNRADGPRQGGGLVPSPRAGKERTGGGRGTLSSPPACASWTEVLTSFQVQAWNGAYCAGFPGAQAFALHRARSTGSPGPASHQWQNPDSSPSVITQPVPYRESFDIFTSPIGSVSPENPDKFRSVNFLFKIFNDFTIFV